MSVFFHEATILIIPIYCYLECMCSRTSVILLDEYRLCRRYLCHSSLVIGWVIDVVRATMTFFPTCAPSGGYQGAAAHTALFCSFLCVKLGHAQGAHLESMTWEHTWVLQVSNKSGKSEGLGVLMINKGQLKISLSFSWHKFCCYMEDRNLLIYFGILPQGLRICVFK